MSKPECWINIFLTPPEAVINFWAKVDKSSPAPDCRPELGRCWDWIGQILPQGYGVFRFTIAPYTYRQPLAHRMAYEFTKGPIPEGKSLDHLCRNRKCCNPEHLEAVTTGENVRRGKSFSGVNFRKKHCPRGHLLVKGNLSQSKLKIGKRSCLTCDRLLKRERRWRLRRKNARTSQIRRTN